MGCLESSRRVSGDPAISLMELLNDYAIYCPNTPSLRGMSQDSQSREPVGLAGGRLPEAVGELIEAAAANEILGDAMDEVRDLLDWASDFSTRSSAGVPLSPSAARSRMVIQFVDRFMADGRNTLTGYDASEGALYILYCAVLALHLEGSKMLGHRQCGSGAQSEIGAQTYGGDLFMDEAPEWWAAMADDGA